MNPTVQQILKKHFAKLGKKGGEAKSEKKAEACRQNAKKPRPRNSKSKGRSVA